MLHFSLPEASFDQVFISGAISTESCLPTSAVRGKYFYTWMQNDHSE